MKKVAVIHQDGRVLWTYEIDLGGSDPSASDDDYFAQAKSSALADGYVNTEEEADQLTFQFVL